MDGSVICAPPDQGWEQRLRQSVFKSRVAAVDTRVRIGSRGNAPWILGEPIRNASFFRPSLEIFITRDQCMTGPVSGNIPMKKVSPFKMADRPSKARLHGRYQRNPAVGRPSSSNPAANLVDLASYPGSGQA